MDRERVALTAHELRVLAEVESTLRHDDPDLDQTLGGHGAMGVHGLAGPWAARRRRLVPLVVSSGACVLVGGLIAGLVPVAFLGFVTLVGGAHAWARRWRPMTP